MKTTRKIALLLLAVAVGNSAQAQAKKLPAGTAYTISSETAATGTGISYQWYRDGQAINGATSASYTVTAGNANGYNVEFKRGVKSTSCVGDVVFSNAVVLSFCHLIVSGVCWAHVNVAQPGTFAAKPDMYTEFYQWNRPNKAWAVTGSASNWDSSNITDPGWASTPCPSGWRLPTLAEVSALASSGYTWASSGSARGNAVAGGFFGPNYNTPNSCTLPSTMTNCVFLPASGGRERNNGTLESQGSSGNYWSATQYDNIGNAYRIIFNSSSGSSGTDGMTVAKNIRCVQ